MRPVLSAGTVQPLVMLGTNTALEERDRQLCGRKDVEPTENTEDGLTPYALYRVELLVIWSRSELSLNFKRLGVVE